MGQVQDRAQVGTSYDKGSEKLQFDVCCKQNLCPGCQDTLPPSRNLLSNKAPWALGGHSGLSRVALSRQKIVNRPYTFDLGRGSENAQNSSEANSLEEM